MKLNSVLLLSLVFFTGCATTYKNPDALMSASKTYKKNLTLDQNYQKVYRILAKMSRKCLQQSSLGNKLRTEESLDTQKRIGEIKLINDNVYWGDDYFGYYLVKPIARNKSELSMYHQNQLFGAFNDHSKKIESWLNGNKLCFLPRTKKY